MSCGHQATTNLYRAFYKLEELSLWLDKLGKGIHLIDVFFLTYFLFTLSPPQKTASSGELWGPSREIKLRFPNSFAPTLIICI